MQRYFVTIDYQLLRQSSQGNDLWITEENMGVFQTTDEAINCADDHGYAPICFCGDEEVTNG